MPNPSGSNQFYVPEPKYGDVKKMKGLIREAPMSGAPHPATTAPQKAQARAVQGPQKPSKRTGGAGTPPDYQAELASIWAEIAAVPGASPLLAAIAERARMQLG